MKKLHFEIAINAPKQKVWEIMLADATYRMWTKAFQEGSYYEGSWEEGSRIRFLGPNKNGTVDGMLSEIAENRPYEYISIHHIGQIIDGVEEPADEEWGGAHENYTFEEKDRVTTLRVDIDTADALVDEFSRMWPEALLRLKKIVETS